MTDTLPIDNTLLADETLLERGHAALVAALGVQGAMQFLAIRNVADGSPPARTGRKSIGLQVGIPAAGSEMVLRFSRPVSWMKLSAAESRSLATKLVEAATVLEKREGFASPIAHRDTGMN